MDRKLNYYYYYFLTIFIIIVILIIIIKNKKPSAEPHTQAPCRTSSKTFC